MNISSFGNLKFIVLTIDEVTLDQPKSERPSTSSVDSVGWDTPNSPWSFLLKWTLLTVVWFPPWSGSSEFVVSSWHLQNGIWIQPLSGWSTLPSPWFFWDKYLMRPWFPNLPSQLSDYFLSKISQRSARNPARFLVIHSSQIDVFLISLPVKTDDIQQMLQTFLLTLKNSPHRLAYGAFPSAKKSWPFCRKQQQYKESDNHLSSNPDCSTTSQVPSFTICLVLMKCWNSVLPWQIFTCFPDFHRVVGVHNIWFGRRLQEFFTHFCPSHVKISFCKDKIESIEWQDSVSRQRTGDCIQIHILIEDCDLQLSNHQTLLHEVELRQCVFCKEPLTFKSQAVFSQLRSCGTGRENDMEAALFPKVGLLLFSTIPVVAMYGTNCFHNW